MTPPPPPPEVQEPGLLLCLLGSPLPTGSVPCSLFVEPSWTVGGTVMVLGTRRTDVLV